MYLHQGAGGVDACVGSVDLQELEQLVNGGLARLNFESNLAPGPLPAPKIKLDRLVRHNG